MIQISKNIKLSLVTLVSLPMKVSRKWAQIFDANQHFIIHYTKYLLNFIKRAKQVIDNTTLKETC